MIKCFSYSRLRVLMKKSKAVSPFPVVYRRKNGRHKTNGESALGRYPHELR